MGLGKALGFSLLAYVGLNFLFVIISYTISGGLNLLFSAITSNPLMILLIFFGPIREVPGVEIFNLYGLISSGTYDATLIQAIGVIVTPFVASIVAGRTGGSKGSSLGGWMITCLISSSALGVLGFISPSTLGFTAADAVMFLITVSISAAINGVFYGCFALLFTKTEMY